MDVTWFPFDSQICTIKLGSWTYSALEMELKLASNSTDDGLSTFVKHGEWKVLEFKGEISVKIYDCCPEP